MTRFFQTAIACHLRLAALALPALLCGGGCGMYSGRNLAAISVAEGRGLAAAPATVDSITVVSWNIQYGEDLDQARRELAADPHLATADILLLQEMDPAGSRRLAGALGFHFVYGSALAHPHHGRLFGNAVLSRWPIVAHRELLLPHPAQFTGHRRLVVMAEIDLGGGRRLQVASIHTETMVMDQDLRLEQARAAADSLDGAAGLTVIGGDFNTVSEYEVIALRQAMRRSGLAAVRLPAGPTIRGRLKKLPGTTPVLDHFFCRGLTAGATGIASEAAASDHYPIWAVLRPENQQ